MEIDQGSTISRDNWVELSLGGQGGPLSNVTRRLRLEYLENTSASRWSPKWITVFFSGIGSSSGMNISRMVIP